MKRKMTALLLALCLVITLVPWTAFAAGDVIRLAGDDRFRTAFAAADQMKAELGISKFDAVIVTSGTNFADALSGSYLAAVKQAPILLTCTAEGYADLTAAYIRENLNEGGTVYILGGEKAVAPALEQTLEGYAVKRLAGDHRYATNLAILEEAGTAGKPVLVCDGGSFADSLSASAAGLPILLVGSGLLDEQKAFLESGSGELYIIGGTAAVSETVEAELSAYGKTTRIGGKDRLETSAAIARTFFPTADSAVLAYGWNFPDGLCGGALAYAMGAPLLLTAEGFAAQAADYVQEKQIFRGVVLGGSGLLPDQTVETVFSVQPPEETVPPETEPPVTEPPVTEPPVTEPPVTEPPVTEPPVTEPPVTEPPVTEPPVTEPPVTEPPVTEPPETVPEETVPSGENVVDITEKLDNLMHQSAAELTRIRDRFGYTVAATYYYLKVTDGGDWDIKRTAPWKFEEGKIYVYQGKVMRMDDPGNIHFGYVGAVIFPEEFVCFGAGMNNVSKFGYTTGDFASYYDDPQDQEMMRWGYHLYESGY